MTKFVMMYEDNSGSMNNRFFECDEDSIPFPIYQTVFYDEDPEFDEDEQEFLDKLDINFESEESFIIFEIPDNFQKI